MGFELHGNFRKLKNTFKKLEEVPTEIGEGVLKSVVDDAVGIMKKNCPKDTGKSASCIKVLMYKTDHKTYFKYTFGFDSTQWEVWKGVWFQNFTGKHSNGRHIGWMQKTGNEISKMAKRKVEVELQKYFNSLLG